MLTKILESKTTQFAQLLDGAIRFAKRPIGRVGSLMFMLASITGCMGYDSISNEVRAGGTVLVAVDAIRNAMPDEGQAYATFEDSAGVTHNVKVRYLLRVQPDPVSDIGLGFVTTIKGFYAGQKVAVIDMIDPITQQVPENPAIAEGAGVLKLMMPDINAQSKHSLSILPQSSLPEPPANFLRVMADIENDLIYQNDWLSLGRALPHLVLKTTIEDGFDNNQIIAGATFHLRARNLHFGGSAQKQPFGVTKLTSDPNIQLAWHYKYNPASEFSDLLVTISNPHGFQSNGMLYNRPMPKSTFADLSSVAIGWQRGQYTGASTHPLELVEQPVFFDLQGERLSGLVTEIVRQI